MSFWIGVDIKKGNFSVEDLESAKKLIIASIKSICSEQDTEITYYYGQELSDTFVSVDDYANRIQQVTKSNIEELAKEIWVNTIYFLRD